MEKIKWYLEHYQDSQITSFSTGPVTYVFDKFLEKSERDSVAELIHCLNPMHNLTVADVCDHLKKQNIPFHIRPAINFKQGFTKTLETWLAAAICMIHLKYGSWNRWYARLQAKKYGKHTDFWYNGIGVLCTKPFSPSQKRRIIKTLYPRHTSQDYISLVNELNASGFNPIVKFRPWETNSFANVFRRYRFYKIVKYHTNK